MDGGVANNTPISHAIELGAREIYVLPTGHACALERPPGSALGMALHALSLLTHSRLIADIELHRHDAKLIVMPPPCPLAIAPIDFAHAAELIERSAHDSRAFLQDGGADSPPIRMRMHRHATAEVRTRARSAAKRPCNRLNDTRSRAREPTRSCCGARVASGRRASVRSSPTPWRTTVPTTCTPCSSWWTAAALLTSQPVSSRLSTRTRGRADDDVHERRAELKRAARLDPESQAWIDQLSPQSPQRDAAIGALHAHLLKAARYEVARRRTSFPHLRGDDFDDLAQQSADDALVAVLGKLDDFRGDSRFTTWAYKFALFEAGDEDPPPRLAGTRGAARARELVAARPGRARPHRRTPRPRSSSPLCRTRSGRSSVPTSARSSSRSHSTTSRSTSWPNGSTRPAARSTRPSTTLDTSSDAHLAARGLGATADTEDTS